MCSRIRTKHFRRALVRLADGLHPIPGRSFGDVDRRIGDDIVPYHPPPVEGWRAEARLLNAIS